MGMQLANLDQRTRAFMLQEFRKDLADAGLYYSPRLSESGKKEFANLLESAIVSGNDEALAAQLRTRGSLNPTLMRKKPTGGEIVQKMPINAPETLAEGEFNRFYVRGLCLRAIEEGIEELEVCRAKRVSKPRPESEALIGKKLNAKALLEDLRANPGKNTALGVPMGPNSGLTVRLPPRA